MSNTSSLDKFSVFFPLYKVEEQDDGSVMVWTRGTQEVPDSSREIMDYASTSPHIRKWSDEAIKRSDGKSKGNIRAMHQPIAAGILKDLNFIDDEKAVDLCIQVIDPVEVKKVKTGVYTGASMGGQYLKRWPDAQTGYVRYTGKPNEFSLVDAPAVPTATFQMVKADGATEAIHFQNTLVIEPTPENEIINAPAAPPADTGDNPPAIEQVVEGVPSAAEALAPPAWMAEFTTAVKDVVSLYKTAQAEKDRQEDLLKSIGSRVGIARRAGEPLMAPQDYPADPDEYGDPANFAYPVSKAWIAKTVSRFNGEHGIEKYSLRERNILGRRIARLAKSAGADYQYDPQSKKIERNKTMTDVKKLDIGALKDQLDATLSEVSDQIAQDPDAVRSLLMEMMNALVSKAPTAGASPATPVTTGAGTTLKGDGAETVGSAPSTPSTPSTATAPSTASTPSTPSGATMAMAAPAETPSTAESLPSSSATPTDAYKMRMDDLDKKLDKLMGVVEKLATAPVAKADNQSPLGDLNALVTKKVTPELDNPIIKALEDGGPYALLKALKAAGADDPATGSLAWQTMNNAIRAATYADLEQGGVITASRFGPKLFTPPA